MEHIKKRRNSILKKPPTNEDETTVDITTKIKRRISFSGKKSVKEFIPGEEEATIWGTSYEESADCLQANSIESGLVNVNEKRIVLRNRRVVVEPNNGTKRRSKKKVHVAENDKENMYIQQTQMESPIEVNPLVAPAIKVESPVKSELTLVKKHPKDVKSQTMSDPIDRVNMWSSTFDFINCSALINKTITIEHSVDVTLNENELQMLKFRVPVTAADVSPNLSLSSLKDNSLPNVFCSSLLMSEEDANMLKLIRERKKAEGATIAGIRTYDTEKMNSKKHTNAFQSEDKVDMGQMVNSKALITARESENKRQVSLHVNEPMNVSKCEVADPKPKRKTITNAVDIVADETGDDSDQTLKAGLMNLVTSAGEENANKMQTTMHMNQTVNVTRCESAEVKNLKRKTITKAVNMDETNFRLDSTVKSHTNAIDSSLMDINSPMRKKPMHNATSKPMDITNIQSTNQKEPNRRQTIHFESAAVDESVIHNRVTSCPDVVVEQSQMDQNISMELSACEPTESESTAFNSTRGATRMDEDYNLELKKNPDIEEQKITNNHHTIHFTEQEQMNFSIDISMRRQSIHTPNDMIEDSPKVAKPIYAPHHETIRTHSNMIEDFPKESIPAAESNVATRQTIYSSAEIVEEVPQGKQLTVSASNSSNKQRKSIYTTIDIVEDSPKATKPTQSTSVTSAVNKCLKQRKSIYTAVDIIECSPKAAKNDKLPDSNVLSHQTIYASADIVEEVPAKADYTIAKVSGKKRESIYTPTDIIEDSPKSTKFSETIKSNAIHAQITCADIMQGSPKATHSRNVPLKDTIKQHQTIYTSSEIIEDSPNVNKPTQASKSNDLQRQSIYTSSDIIEDSPKTTGSIKVPHKDTIKTNADLCGNSPKSGLRTNQLVVSGPKVIVKHLNLKPGMSGDQAALRILRNQQAKSKPNMETKTDEFVMDMSDLDGLPKSTKKINFCQLNEEMFRGEAKAFAEEHRSKISLFARLENRPTEELKFDSFMDKSNAGCLIQPVKNLTKDYTMELSVGKTLNNQRGRESEYTMDLSLGGIHKPHQTISCDRKCVDGPHESINPFRIQMNEATMNLSMDMHQKSQTHSKMEQPIRQSIHFHKEIVLDESTNLPQREAISEIKKQTIIFNQKIDFDESTAPELEDSMDLSMIGVSKVSNNKGEMVNDIGDTANRCQLSQRNHIKMDLSIQNSPTEKVTPSDNKAVTQAKRQTIHFNHNNNLEESLLENQDPSCIVKQAKVLHDDSTMDLCMQQKINSEENKLEHPSAMRKTIFNNQNLEESPPKCLSRSLHLNATQTKDNKANKQNEDTKDLSARILHKSLTRQSSYAPHVVDFDESRCQAAIFGVSVEQSVNQPRRQTIHCNEDLELENTNSDHLRMPTNSKTSNRQTIYFNNGLEEDTNVKPVLAKMSKLQSNHFGQDLEIDNMNNQHKAPIQISKTSKRQTVHFNEDLEVEDIERKPVLVEPTKVFTRQTLHFNQDLEIEGNTKEQVFTRTCGEEARRVKLFNETKKNTAENALTTSKSNRRTVHFEQNNDLEESVIESQPSVHTSHDDSTMNLSIARENNLQEEKINTLPMPRRLTILGDHPIDIEASPQKLPTRKSSFSRTLNFNEIQTTTSKMHSQTKVDMDISDQEQAKVKVNRHTTFVDGKDSPLYYFKSKSKSCETTSEIDRSLAEYLKAEAAATLLLNSSQDMRMEVVESRQNSPYKEYYDLKDKVVDEQQSKSRRQTSYESNNIFEESGMQPLQKSVLKRETIFDSEDMQPSEEMLQIHSKTRQHKNQALMEREPTMGESENYMDLCNLSEKKLKSKETLNRKTIHFTDEDAVDESFFDEKLKKPAASQNQKNGNTFLFNDTKNPIGDMEVTLSVNKAKSQAIESLKQILQESNMLFTQSKILKPSTFESKRSTICFADKDNLMDMTSANEIMEFESPKVSIDPECTPTKNKLSKSRIPQLIDSAKKLRSMKKSMELIQQELPNFACATQREDTPKETIKLQESFNTLDIPRKGTTFEPNHLKQSFDTIEIPRRVTTDKPRNLQESFDTVEIPRRATIFQKNDTLCLCPNEKDITNVSQKSLYKFEDAPITVSDVSTFFAQKLVPPTEETNDTYSPNTTEALCNFDVNRLAKDDDQLPKSSDSEDTTHNFDKFKKRYVELTCDSIMLSGFMEDIEKTHLSLVNTLDEQSEVVNSVCPQQSAIIVKEEPLKLVSAVPPPSETLKPISSVCRKCKRNRLSVTQNDTTIGSFMFDPLPVYKMDLAALHELATKPKISDIAKVWQQKMRESDSFNISDGSRNIASDDSDSVDDFIAALDNERLIAAQQRPRKENKKEVSFVHRVRKKMLSKKSNWILNELLLAGGILKFTHARIRTFAIFISFTPNDPRGIEVNFSDIQLVPNVLHTRQWTPFDYALHYQLLVELPFDLRKLCPTSENLFQLLEHVEEVTQDVLKTGKDMLYLVLTSPASLIRESSGSLYIRKYARTKTPQNEVKRTEFQIEVRNIKKLSYESIVVPPLYEFDEKIQLLPMGQDFLREFLTDPMRYMKT